MDRQLMEILAAAADYLPQFIHRGEVLVSPFNLACRFVPFRGRYVSTFLMAKQGTILVARLCLRHLLLSVAPGTGEIELHLGDRHRGFGRAVPINGISAL